MNRFWTSAALSLILCLSMLLPEASAQERNKSAPMADINCESNIGDFFITKVLLEQARAETQRALDEVGRTKAAYTTAINTRNDSLINSALAAFQAAEARLKAAQKAQGLSLAAFTSALGKLVVCLQALKVSLK